MKLQTFVGQVKNLYISQDMEPFSRREKMLDLREQLLSVEEDRMAGNKGYTIDELDKYLDDIISGV